MTNNTLNIGWNFDNSYSRLSPIFYKNTNPVKVTSPQLVKLNHTLAETLGLNADQLEKEGAHIFAGNQIVEGMEPIAQAYAGHQFGNFTMLGDGRAVLLGEHITPDKKRVDIQLKGSGRTPFSCGGDGRAALGPMLREYIISEAMYALGIPTTRSLAVVTTGEIVPRATELPGAILTRVAKSHIRVGTFQYAISFGTIEDLKSLADYTIDRHYTNLLHEANSYLHFLKEVVKRQASLIAKWQLVGFIHGVMNTDNMTISGETIDYGPCAFMDVYDPETVFSSIDIHGRYKYKNQPHMAIWNLARFAETLIPLLHPDENEAIQLAQDAISTFAEEYEERWLCGMRCKLGLFNEDEEDRKLIGELLDLMAKYRADYTNTFVSLTLNEQGDSLMFQSSEFKKWRQKWEQRVESQNKQKEEITQLMKRNNPFVIPRNHRVEEALEAAEQDDFNVLDRLLNVISNPYAYSKVQEEYRKLPEQPDKPYRTFCGT